MWSKIGVLTDNYMLMKELSLNDNNDSRSFDLILDLHDMENALSKNYFDKIIIDYNHEMDLEKIFSIIKKTSYRIKFLFLLPNKYSKDKIKTGVNIYKFYKPVNILNILSII